MGVEVSGPMTSADTIEEGRRAFHRRAWGEAFDLLSGAGVDSSADPEDLESLAIAAYLSGHDAESTAAWTRAHQIRIERDETPAAVRCAFWLGFGLFQRGEMAQGGGWMARARRLVEEQELDCAESGYLLIPEGLMALEGGEPSTAVGCFEELSHIARRFGDPDLAAFGNLGMGQAFLRMGDATKGASFFDEAMVAVTAGEVSSVVSGIIYCAVIDECQKAFDMHRAQEWTLALDRWCEAQPGLVPYRGQCLVHRSQVMQLHGAWAEAATEAEKARQRLEDPPHPGIGMAHYQLGELHRLRGDLASAEEAYRRAHGSGRSPQPGLALLRLAQDRAEHAAAGIDRALDAAGDRLARARLLPAYVKVMLSAGRVSEARSAADELSELAADTGTAMLKAAALDARGAVFLAEGETTMALDELHRALQEWQAMDAPYETAQTRVLIALGCRAEGDQDTAELERDAARSTLQDLGAHTDLAGLDKAFGPARRESLEHPISSRELEVLRHVARGATNREISEELVISEKTVERHLSNIFTKLGVSNRAAATAYAYDHHLV